MFEKTIRLLPLAFAAMAIASAACAQSSQEVIEKGRYLVTIGGVMTAIQQGIPKVEARFPNQIG